MTFSIETSVKMTRKAFVCEGCGLAIEIGEAAAKLAWINDGSFYAAAYHPDCREAECALNGECGSAIDDWTRLSDFDLEDWREFLLVYPAVVTRLGIREAME